MGGVAVAVAVADGGLRMAVADGGAWCRRGYAGKGPLIDRGELRRDRIEVQGMTLESVEMPTASIRGSTLSATLRTFQSEPADSPGTNSKVATRCT